MTRNRRIVLAREVRGAPAPADFELAEAPLPGPAAGEALVRHLYLSLDPYIRPALAGRHGGDGPLGPGDMPPGETIGQVIASRDTALRPGQLVRHRGGWQEYSVAPASGLARVPPTPAPASLYLGVLGMPGLTAWASITQLAAPAAGQSVLVSAAAGPVGATLGQIARLAGARVVGIAGGAEKCALVTGKFRFDDCVDYKAPDYPERLAAALPDGADIYHDNVGGPMLEDALKVLRDYGTVVLCGLMDQYNDPASARGLYLGLPIIRRAVMKGLVVYDFEHRRDEFVAFLAPHVDSGEVRWHEDRAQGIEAAPAHFARLMHGANVGKSLVVLAEAE